MFVNAVRIFESNRTVTSVFGSKREQLFEKHKGVQENDVSVKMCLFTVLLLTMVRVLYLLEVFMLVHQVLKLLQQKPQQCGAIKTVEFILQALYYW